VQLLWRSPEADARPATVRLRLRDIAVRLGITERTAHGVLTDLVQAGYVTKTKDGRRNHYQIQVHLPLPEPGTREPSIGELLAVLLGDTPGIAGPAAPHDHHL
jgi:IclR helix-turn-helix domain